MRTGVKFLMQKIAKQGGKALCWRFGCKKGDGDGGCLNGSDSVVAARSCTFAQKIVARAA